MNGKEQDGPHHAEPAGKKWGRKDDIIGCGQFGCVFCNDVGGLQELCGAHPGPAHQDHHQDSRVNLYGRVGEKQNLQSQLPMIFTIFVILHSLPLNSL